MRPEFDDEITYEKELLDWMIVQPEFEEFEMDGLDELIEEIREAEIRDSEESTAFDSEENYSSSDSDEDDSSSSSDFASNSASDFSDEEEDIVSFAQRRSEGHGRGRGKGKK